MEATLPKIKSWFDEYVSRFASADQVVQRGMDLKEEHSRRVCEAISSIGRSLGLSREDMCLAEVAGLLHDIGRFEQYSRYGTFSDRRSEDHAALGVKVIQASPILEELEPTLSEMILKAVGYHNRASLPMGEDERSLFFLKLLRDADKVDIWRVVTDYYQQGGPTRNRAIELDLPDEPGISDSVYRALMNGNLVQMGDLKTLNDFKLLQMGWIYDINFPHSFQIVQEKGYLEMIRDALPKASPRVAEVYERARAHMEAFSSAA